MTSVAVDLWIAPLEGPLSPSQEAACYRVLSPQEISAADRYRTQARRAQALAGRALLRCAAARVLGEAPGGARLRLSPRGRPLFEGVDANLSHADGCVVCAVSAQARVGVDVERLDRAAQIERVMARVFAAEEIAAAGRLEGGERARALTRLWGLKEAYAKALGLGLGLDFRRIAFEPPPWRGEVTLDRRRAARGWRFEATELGGLGVAMALATRATEAPRVRRRDGWALLLGDARTLDGPSGGA